MAQFNTDLDEWLITVANTRKVRRIGNASPIANITDELAAMRRLPPMMPHGGFTDRRKLGRNYLFRVLGNDYSCPPEFIGRLIDIHASLSAVVFTFAGRVVAEHLRCIDTGQTIIDPTHVTAAGHLRRAFQEQPPALPIQSSGTQVEYRSLADYDKVFGITLGDSPEE